MTTTRVRERCRVLSCVRDADQTWSTGETPAEEATWRLCLPHYKRMRRGEDWATHTDLPTSTEQWIVMGPDLGIRAGEFLQGWHLSVEFGADGRNIRLSLSTHEDQIGVLLDGDHASQLSKALSDLGSDRPERDWTY